MNNNILKNNLVINKLNILKNSECLCFLMNNEVFSN